MFYGDYRNDFFLFGKYICKHEIKIFCSLANFVPTNHSLLTVTRFFKDSYPPFLVSRHVTPNITTAQKVSVFGVILVHSELFWSLLGSTFGYRSNHHYILALSCRACIVDFCQCLINLCLFDNYLGFQLKPVKQGQ